MSLFVWRILESGLQLRQAQQQDIVWRIVFLLFNLFRRVDGVMATVLPPEKWKQGGAIPVQRDGGGISPSRLAGLAQWSHGG